MKTDKKQENNIIDFCTRSDLLGELAEEKLKSGDLEGAMRNFLSLEKLVKPSRHLIRTIADLAHSLGIYNMSCHYWFRFLNMAGKTNKVEAYNGLGANYFLMGDQELAAYYFQLQVMDKNDKELPYDDYLYELFGKGLSGGENVESELAKLIGSNKPFVEINHELESDDIKKAKNLYDTDPDAAKEIFEKVPYESVNYVESQFCLGMAAVIEDRFEDAEKLFENIVSIDPDDLYACNNLLGIYVMNAKMDKMYALADEMEKRDIADATQLLKYCVMFSKRDMHEQAYEFSKTVLRLVPLSFETKIVHALCAYNVEKFEESEQLFCRCYCMTDYYLPGYYYGLAKEAVRNKQKKHKKLKIAFTLPDSEIENLLKEAELFVLNGHNSPAKLKKKSDYIFGFAERAFCTDSYELQTLGCHLIFMMGTNKAKQTLLDYLLRPQVPSHMKTLIISLLVKLGYDRTTGTVFDGVYAKVAFETVSFDSGNADLFNDAYSLAFGRMAEVCAENVSRLKPAIYTIYYTMLDNGTLEKAKDAISIAALAVEYSRIAFADEEDKLLEFFSLTKSEYEKTKKLFLKKQRGNL